MRKPLILKANSDHENGQSRANNTFRFPRRGGTGAIWTSLVGQIPGANKRFSDAVTGIDAANRTVTTASGATFSYEQLISTLPLDRLAKLVGDPALIEHTSKLLYSSVHVVGIGLRGQPPEELRTKCWMYFPEDDCPFYRVTVFSNYSPYNTPAPGETWSAMAEVSESKQKLVAAPPRERAAESRQGRLCVISELNSEIARTTLRP